MDGGRGGDASNFFNRIKNVDVLRSPYPRHLAQNNQRPGMAASTRPIIGGNVAPHNTMRPAATRATPAWQSPPPHPDIANTVHTGGGSSIRSYNDRGRVPSSPALYRPPPEYPNSVQPIRVRPYGMGGDYRHIPGSTFPSHVSAGLSKARNMPHNAPYCVLRNWIVCVDVDKMAVTVSGSFTKPNGNTVARHSSSIEMAIDERVLRASSGTVYQLVDTPDLDLMRTKGFPEYLIPYFVDGFPRNWKRLVDDYLAVAAGAQHGRGAPLSRRDGYPMMNRVVSPSGNLHDEHRGLDHSDGRFRHSSDDGDAADLQPSTSPIVGYGASSHTGIRQTRPFEGTGMVYRSGAEIFANGRFSRGGRLHTPIRAQQRHSSENPRSPELYDPDGANDKGAVASAVGDERHIPSMQRVDSELAAAMSNMPLETPTKASSSAGTGDMLSNTISPELGATSGLLWKGFHDPHVSLNDSAIEPFKLEDAGIDDSQSDHEELVVDQPPDPKVDGTSSEDQKQNSTNQKDATRKSRRTSRKVVESSDDARSQHMTEPDTSEPFASTPVTRSRKSVEARSTSAQRPVRNAASATRKPALATPSKRKDASNVPNSAPVARAKTARSARNKRTARRTPNNVVTAAEQTPSKPPRTTKSAGRHCGSSSTSNAMVVIEPSKNISSSSDEASSFEASAPAWAMVGSQKQTKDKTSAEVADRQDESLPEPTAGGELLLPPSPSPPVQEPSAIAGRSERTPAKAAPLAKAESAPSKWRVGRRFFKYKEPVATTSVTRSGRKVRRPQQWWANAQEHLASTHKGSTLKYRWGTGDAVIVRDGKRMRLSDVFLEGSSADLTLADQDIDDKGDTALSDASNEI
ncbi:hypothetical protein H4R24_005548 [Coemansia sp. RSA 988]|nr:hypothetical protein H4R24_005548 [Coemansia sp. RSA 988]